MRSIWLTVCLAFMILFGASLASAQNGLQRFESDIKPQIELKSFSYASAAALGSAGFVLNDVTAVIPGNPATGDKESTIKIEKVTVDELDFDRLKKSARQGEDVPRFAKMKIEGITGDDDLFKALAPYGVPKVPVDLTLDYRLDTATKVLTLSKLEVNLRGQARVALSVVLDGISDKSSQMQGSKDDGRLRSASLDIDDTGLIAKVLPAVAKAQGTAPEALVAVAVAMVGSLAPNQGPATMKALDAIASYVADWKQPKGPIKISIKPAKTAGLSDLDKAMEPNALTDLFGLAVDYAGTRAGAAGGGTAPQAAAAAPPAAGGTPPAQSGPEAWLAIVGNTLTGKSDGKEYFDLYRKDGTLSTLQDGEITAGKWTIEGEKVCIKYPDEDKECFLVKRIGDEVTMTDAKGNGTRATFLPGNPKNL